MTLAARGLAAALGLASLLGGAQAADGDEARRRLVEQKLRLVEGASSPASQDAARRARAALEDNRLDEAGNALDAALRGAGKAAARATPPAASRADLDKLAEQIAAYLVAIEELARQGSGDASGIAARLVALRAEAEKLVAGGRLAEADRKLSDAYGLAVQALVRLRAGQTVTMSLRFDTPAEEYAYERRRFRSNEMLVGMMVGEGRAEGERARVVDALLQEARSLAAGAAEKAATADHSAAVTAMEAASGRLNRALQTMGVPVF